MTFGPYRVGDIPSSLLRIDIERDGYEADTTIFDGITAELVRPSGFSDPLAAQFENQDILVALPADRSLFNVRGVYRVALSFTSADGYRERATDVPLIVEAEDGWHTLDTARLVWATSADDLRLFELLDLARLQVTEYAPGKPARGTVNLRAAQLMQARNILNASKADPSADESGFVIQPYPLDRFVRELIRPRRAVGRVG